MVGLGVSPTAVASGMIWLHFFAKITSIHAQWTQAWNYDSGYMASTLQPAKREAHAMVNFEDSIIIFGGAGSNINDDDEEYSDTWQFDLLTHTWTKIVEDSALNPGQRFHHSGVLHSNDTVNELIVFGGVSITTGQSSAGTSDDDAPVVQYNDVWRLSLVSSSSGGNVSSIQWTKDETSSPVVPAKRSEAGVVIHDNQLYVFGGISYDESGLTAPVDYNDLWRYDLSTNIWTEIAPTGTSIPTTRFSHSVSLLQDVNGGSYLMVFSGRHLKDNRWSLLSDIWLYSMSLNTWISVSSSIQLMRAYTSIVTVNGLDMWFFGGYYKSNQGIYGYVYDDVVLGEFTLKQIAATASDHSNTNAVSSGDSASSSATIATPKASVHYSYDVVNSKVASPPLRYNHHAVVWRDCMVIHGGSYYTQYGDVWYKRQYGDVWLYNTTTAVMRDDFTGFPMDVETLIYVLAGFIVSIVIILLLLLIRWRRVDQRNLELARMQGAAVVRGVSMERLKQLKITKYKRSDPIPTCLPTSDGSNFDEDVCPICLIEFEDDEDVRNLPCKHIFHVQCIDEWLRRNTSCPMCKCNVDLDAVNITIESPLPPAHRSGAIIMPVPNSVE